MVDIVIKPADKRFGTVVMDNDWSINECSRQLNDIKESKYIPRIQVTFSAKNTHKYFTILFLLVPVEDLSYKPKCWANIFYSFFHDILGPGQTPYFT